MENFDDAWKRIQEATPIKSMTQLAKIIGVSQPAISQAKRRREFQANWAYKIGNKYGLPTEWIMTGEGPKRIPQPEQPQAQQAAPQPPPTADPPTADFLVELETWAREISGHQDLRWLEKQLETCLPTWRTWREERKKAETEADTHQVKVA